jgi:hypothetical protein
VKELKVENWKEVGSGGFDIYTQGLKELLQVLTPRILVTSRSSAAQPGEALETHLLDTHLSCPILRVVTAGSEGRGEPWRRLGQSLCRTKGFVET